MRAILTYHSIDPSGSPISLDASTFEQHIRWLCSGRVRVLTIDDLLAAPDSDDGVAITFDDGFANFGEVAAPRLIDAGLPSTLFVVSDYVNRTNAWGGIVTPGIPDLPLLGWDALRRLSEQGVVLGAHTRTHPDLTTLDSDRVREELRGSADAVAREVGRRPEFFAYPFGAVTPDVAAMAATEFRGACTTEFATLTNEVSSAYLPRLDAFYFRDCRRLEAFGTPAFAQFVRRRHSLRRIRRWIVR